MKFSSSTRLAGLALITSLLVACGGGSDHEVEVRTPSPDTVPGGIADSVNALIEFARNLMADDTAEPLLLGDAQPATDDTAEPSGL